MKQLVSLFKIDGSANQIKTCPDVSECEQLLSVNFSQNQIEALPSENVFHTCFSLLELNFSQNLIKAIPEYVTDRLVPRGVEAKFLGNPCKTLEKGFVSFGFSELFGKRPNMEDAFIILPCFTNDKTSLFGIFDGHGNFSELHTFRFFYNPFFFVFFCWLLFLSRRYSIKLCSKRTPKNSL